MAYQPKTVRELVYWEYAKLIAEKATGARSNYRFVVFSYKRLVSGKISPSTILTENQHLFRAGDVCAYCGATVNLQWEHIIPMSIGGPDCFDNLVRACSACNLSKGALDPYQWYAKADIEAVPRVVLGKFLKLVFTEYQKAGLLDSDDYMRSANVTRATLSSIFCQ